MKKLIIIATILIVGLVGYTFLQSQTPKDSSEAIQTDNDRVVDEHKNWQKQTIEEIGLTLRYPTNLTYRQEIADNAGTIRAVGFYLENNDPDNPYTLYGLYQADRPVTIDDLEKAKAEMDTTTIKSVEIDGFSGIEGLIEGDKTRYITTLLIGDKLFSVSTIPPTIQNEEMTDKILTTFDFQ